MKQRLHFLGYIFMVSLTLSALSSNADPKPHTIDWLADVLSTLSDYEFGDPETWKPEFIEVMQTIYRETDTQSKAAAMMADFLGSDASAEAKNAVMLNYYTLVSLDSTDAANEEPDAAGFASPLVVRVAELNAQFRKSRQPVAFIKQKLKTETDELRPHVIRLVRGLPDSFRKGDSFFEIEGLSAHNKAQLLKLLAARKDPSVHRVAKQFAQGEDPALRIAALEAFQSIGRAKDVPFLIEVAVSGTEREKSLAQNALYRMPGRDVDRALTSLVITDQLEAQLEAIKAIEKRYTPSAARNLLTIASKPIDAQLPAIRALSLVAPLTTLDNVIDTLAMADSSKVRKELETAIYRIAFRHGENSRASAIIRDRMNSTENGSVRESLTAILQKLETFRNGG